MAMRAISHAMLLLASPVAGWVTRSQSVYGAQISEIQALMRGEAVSRNQQAQLGYLWYAPPDTNSSRGLGGGITWAWDDNLCDQLNGQMKEDVFFINLVTCNEYKAAVARAFDKCVRCSPHQSPNQFPCAIARIPNAPIRGRSMGPLWRARCPAIATPCPPHVDGTSA